MTADGDKTNAVVCCSKFFYKLLFLYRIAAAEIGKIE